MTEHPKQLLASYNLEPKKSLGQNFLFDENILSQIVGLADVTTDDQVLEIGPGLGSLTVQLAERAGRVIAVELDSRFFPILEGEIRHLDNIELLHGDILEQDPATLFKGPYKVVANVPYYITGAILRHLLGSSQKPSLLVLTVQKEVAERISAVPPNMSLLAVSVQYYGQPQVVKTIKAGAFWPRPAVDSSVVRIDISTGQNMPADPIAEQEFFRVVRAGFSQKRKQLQNNLRQLGLSRADVSELLEKVSVDGRRRAETLTIDEWRAIVREL